MEKLDIAMVVIGVIVLALVYFQWQDTQKLNSIDAALGQVAEAAVNKFRDQVTQYTQTQIDALDKRLKEQSATIGASISNLDQSKDAMRQMLDQVKKTAQDHSIIIQQEADLAVQ